MSMLHLARTGLLAGLASVALAATAAGRVDVSFVDPAKFTDAGFTGLERERIQLSLSQYLQKLGERLPEGQTLKVEITELDLAGWPRQSSVNEVRVLRGGADWPRIDLRYELQEGGRTLKAGAEQLKDMTYLQSFRRTSEADLPYEKRLLADWFADRIAPPRN